MFIVPKFELVDSSVMIRNDSVQQPHLTFGSEDTINFNTI